MVAFHSRQRLYENRLALALVGACLVLVAVLFTVGGAWQEAPWWGVATLGLLAACLAIPLTITVDDEHLRVSSAGVLKRAIPLADIRAVERREYHPLREFGGWGWRWGLTHRNARAYTTAGTSAVVLTLADAQEIYLGVEDEAALLAALHARIGRA